MGAAHEPSTAELARRCYTENERYRRSQHPDRGDCFELFRRAIVEGDADAWAAIYQQYERLVAHWVNGPSERVEERVNEVFARFWRNVRPAHFARDFAGIGPLMEYLRMIARSVRIDDHRREARHQLLTLLEVSNVHTEGIESGVIESITQQDLIAHVQQLMYDETERLVLYYSFVEGLKPRHIAQLCPDLFPDVAEVQRVKERIVLRLSNDPRLRACWEKTV